MSPETFISVVQYFLVPVGVLLIAYAINDQFRLKFSSGSDFYVFFVSLDLNSIIIYPAYKERINPLFSQDYLAIFVMLVIVCVFLLSFTLRTQGQIEDWRGGKWRGGRIVQYPLARVFGSWVATMTLIPTHLFVFFGR
jgi:hypothetical protein